MSLGQGFGVGVRWVVVGVSKRCPGHFGDTLGTLFGHFGARGPKDPWDTPPDTPSDTPIFGDTPSDTPGDTRAQRAERLL